MPRATENILLVTLYKLWSWHTEPTLRQAITQNYSVEFSEVVFRDRKIGVCMAFSAHCVSSQAEAPGLVLR